MRVRGQCIFRAILLFFHVFFLAFISFSAAAQTTAPNEWTWMGGPSTGAAPPVFSKLGTPAAGNIPPGRYEAATWTDKSGNFWLFGGDLGYSPCCVLANDLWELSAATKEWAWMGGSATSNTPGVYGTLGTPSAQSAPGSREGASSWTDNKGNLWLFGGYGLDENGSWVVLNDLWEFSPASGEWTWMSGSSVIGNSCAFNGWGCAQQSDYGTLGTPAPGNTPGSRDAAVTWTDQQGNLWLFGGLGYDVMAQDQYSFNELWEYDISLNEWAWMGGSSTREGSACLLDLEFLYYRCGEPGVYGTEGTAAAGNIPGGRAGATGWRDKQGNLWLFSGNGFDINGYYGDPNDVWEFNPSSMQWTWMGGNSAITANGCDYYDCSGPSLYGPLGSASAGDLPTGRDHGVGWTDSSGNFWLFGGGGGDEPEFWSNGWIVDRYNDLWEFNPSTNQWTLMGANWPTLCGDACVPDPGAVYGVMGTPTAGDNPGLRIAPAGWTDSNGNFWLFGGEAFDPVGYYNDLWEYQPSAAGALPTTATPTFSVPAGSYASAQSVMMNDATDGVFIYYTTDGTTPTFNSTYFNPSFSPPISVQHSATLKAIAVADGCYTSAVATAAYALPAPAATPTFSVPSGTYTSFQTVIISDATPGATIYYTVDGSTPTARSSVYKGPLSIEGSLTLQAVATASGYTISYAGSATYTLALPTAAMPTFSVADGTYTAPQTVTMSDSAPGAIIYYAINGYPSASSSVYSGPITVSASETIRAQATAKNYYPSGIAGATYVINPNAPQTAAPVFSVPGGTYTTPQTVTISDTTPLAAIYFTTDGSTPTTQSNSYSGPILVNQSETLKAIASADGDTISAVTSATYAVNLPTPSFSITGTAISVAPGAVTGNLSTITFTPAGGFTGAISVSCAITPTAASDPATCSIVPVVSITGSAPQTTALTVYTTSPSVALNGGKGLLRPAVGGLALVCIFFAWIPSGQRRKWRVLTMIVLLFAIFGAVPGCGGGGNAGGGGGNSGTTPGAYVVTVTGTSGNITEKGAVSLTVQ